MELILQTHEVYEIQSTDSEKYRQACNKCVEEGYTFDAVNFSSDDFYSLLERGLRIGKSLRTLKELGVDVSSAKPHIMCIYIPSDCDRNDVLRETSLSELKTAVRKYNLILIITRGE